jgi:hypothetical protein
MMVNQIFCFALPFLLHLLISPPFLPLLWKDFGLGLSNLCQKILGQKMDKNFLIRCSDWGNPVLSASQMHYAALDAWVGYQLFQSLTYRHCSHPESIDSELVLQWSSPHINKRPVTAVPKKGAGVMGLIKASDLKEAKLSSRKKELYENCRMRGPDGVLLCTCNYKKIQWYISRDLADLVEEDPPTIQLRFQPGGRGHVGDPYYLAKKENKCVVCGHGENYIRHSIVPHSYRKCFPIEKKSRSSHDIVLVCVVKFAAFVSLLLK